MMEISVLNVVLKNFSRFFNLSSHKSINVELVWKYYPRIEDVLKLLKPILDAIVESKTVYDESTRKAFTALNQSVDELKDLFEDSHPLMSKLFFVQQVELLITKLRINALECFELLKSVVQGLFVEFKSASIEQRVQKIILMGNENTSAIITEALKELVEGSGPSSDILKTIEDCLGLRSNQELLIEAVALEKLKENAEQAERIEEVESINEMISLVTHMHDCLVRMKHSQSCSPVPIPADFCCPLSLELMTDPVIVASGQTYEKMYIRKWLDLGLTVCPKTMQPLAHTNLVPNYTVKAFIANWCESNNVKLPDPIKAMNLNLQTESEAPRVSHILPYQSASQGSTLALSLITTGGTQLEGDSQTLLHSSSEDSLSGVAENDEEPDIGIISNRRSEETQAVEGERTSESVSLSAARTDDVPYQGREMINLEYTTPTNVNSCSQGISVEENLVPAHVTAYSRNGSGEIATERQYPPRIDFRSRHQIRQRPSDRFVPRIAPSNAIETRTENPEVETRVKKLVEALRKSESLDIQRDVTAELRFLSRHHMERIIIANCGAISLLVDLLSSDDSKTQENAVTVILNLSINDNNKTAIANANAIEPLIRVLENGSPEAKENSAATLFSLSVIDDNKIVIGRSGAINPLVDLLGNGSPRGKKDAATALFNLSIFHENKALIVEAGAVKYLVELMDPAAGMVDKAVAVLSNLSTIPEGRMAIGQERGIPLLVDVVELGSARAKENAAAALLQLCTTSGRFCSLVLQGGAVPPLVALSQSGTPRAKEKAQLLLRYFRNQRHGTAGRG